jgi:UDP-N-acetylmuramoyl-L-alanyl-D-glutamate--2,6-diaminopimelate ligase
VQLDRQQAIFDAIHRANGNDIVLIAGKGHEQYQIIGQTKRHFSDQEQVQQALAAKVES